jgi:hypothetical protein
MIKLKPFPDSRLVINLGNRGNLRKDFLLVARNIFARKEEWIQFNPDKLAFDLLVR